MVYAKNAINGTVVFGDQGAGLNRTQLWSPVGIYLDYISNSLIIANYAANNVVRWTRTEQQWTLMAGNINGVGGSTSTTLRGVTDMIFILWVICMLLIGIITEFNFSYQENMLVKQLLV